MIDGDGKIDAYIRSWRVYSIHDDYLSKRPDGRQDASHLIDNRPKVGDALTIRFGGLPPGYYDIQKQVGASLSALLGGPFNSAEDSLDARDKFIDKAADELPIEDVPGKTWLTLELRRPVRLKDATGSRYLWNDMSECGPLIEDFRANMLMAFDVLSASLYAVFPNWLDNVQKDREHIYIGANGKGPTFVPRFEMGVPIVSVGRDWAEIPTGLLDQVGEIARSLLKSGDQAITAPARWLTAARREPDDPFSRFMFAFFGLEMLAAKFEKANGKKTLETIEAAAALPLADLLWPHPHDESKDPFRNTMFRFAFMAVAVSDRPREDIDEFRPLLHNRNQIAHGSSVDIRTLPAAEAEALLGRYLGLVSQNMNGGTTRG